MTTSLFEWNDIYLIGVEELDFEHKDLLRCLKDLHEKIRFGVERAQAEECMGEVCLRFSAHFALEERYMQRVGYSGFAEHKKRHDEFLDEIYDAVEMFSKDLTSSYQEALETRLEGWIKSHILESDKRMIEG